MPFRSVKEKKREQVREARSRMVYIGTLAAGLAHEIRSPLNAIGLNLSLLREDLDAVAEEKRDEFRRRLELITEETEGLGKLLSEFLAFARPPKLERLPTDLNELLRQTAEFVEPECIQAQVELVEDFQEDLFPVVLDQHLFGRSVILNLLRNAREAIGEQGTIKLVTRETNEVIEVRVEDNGGGVPPEQQEKIFEAFHSTKDHGTGLGLAIARRIVHEHGGELLLENRPGQGATFVIRLPKSKILEFRGDPGPRAEQKGGKADDS